MPKAKIPVPSQDASTEELIDIMYRYKKELEYLLMNLDGDNVPIVNSIMEDVEGNRTSITQTAESVVILAEDVDGNAASISVNAQQIALNVSGISTVDGKTVTNASSIVQNADQIALNVSSISTVDGKTDTNASSITINANAIAANVTSISTVDGKTTTNASNITVNANAITSKVSETDYNGNTIASLINQTATTIEISAEKINLNGVTTMSGLAVVNDTLKLGATYGAGKIDMNSGVYIANSGSFGIKLNSQSLQITALATNFEGQVDMNNNDIVGVDDITIGDLMTCDRIRVNGSIAVYGVQDGDSINFFSSTGVSIGGINFSSGVIY